MSLDCSSIEVECLEGVGGAVKWDFKKKQTTLTYLVGVKWAPGLGSHGPDGVTAKLGELSVKAGVAFTFDQNGQLVADGTKVIAEVGASLNASEVSIGGNAQGSFAAVAGLDSEVTYELAHGH